MINNNFNPRFSGHEESIDHDSNERRQKHNPR